MAAPEVGEEESGSFEVATWRVVTLFLVIVAIDTAWEFFDEFVTHRLKTRMQIGLMHAWEQLKFETMALGLISLLLVVCEEQLLKICINSPDDDKAEYGYDTKGDSPYPDAGAPAEAHEEDHHRRRLLASAGGNPCPEGKEPIWESELIHKAHILIFLIAACHIGYAMISISLSMLAMRRWHKFEERVKGGELLPLPLGGLQRQGEPAFVFGLRQCLRQFTHRLDVATYSALRALFVDRVNVGADFNFAAMIQEYLTEEFARVVRFDLVMWGIAILWIVFPEGSYGGFWMTGAFMVASVAAGAKLTAATSHLARHAYSLYYQPPPRGGGGGSGGVPELGRSAGALAPSGGMSADAKEDTKLSPSPPPGPVAESTEALKATPTDPSAEGGVLHASNTPDADAPSTSRALRRALRGHSQRIKAPSGPGGANDDPDSYELLRLFWLRRPRLMLHIFRYAFFQNAIAVAAVIFGFWQDERTIFGGAVRGYDNTVRAIAYLLLFFVLLLLVHTSVILFPLYALTAGTAEFGSPAGVLDFARRRGIRPDLVLFLEETAPAKGTSTKTVPKAKPKCDIAGTLLVPSRSIPEDANRLDGDDSDDDAELPPVAVCDDGTSSDGPQGPEALSAVPAPARMLRAGSVGAPPAGSAGGGFEAVSLSQAYSLGSAVPQHSTQHSTQHAVASPHVEAPSGSGAHGAAVHGHAPGMAATVQGLLEGMAARRVEAMAARMRRPRR